MCSNESGSGWGSQGTLISCRSIQSPFQNAKLLKACYLGLLSSLNLVCHIHLEVLLSQRRLAFSGGFK